MAMIIDGVEHVTAEDAAAILKTTQMRVLMLVKELSLEGRQVDGIWYISRPSLACTKDLGTTPRDGKGCRTHCSSSGCGCR